MGLTLFHVVFLDIFHIQTKCGEYSGILRGIMLVLHNERVYMNNVMKKIPDENKINKLIIMSLESGFTYEIAAMIKVKRPSFTPTLEASVISCQ